MILRGGAIAKRSIGICCTGLLGVTAGTGLVNTEVSSNSLSNLSEKLGSFFESSSSPQAPQQQVQAADLFSSIFLAGNWLQANIFSKVSEYVQSGYSWITASGNSSLLASFLKNFLDLEIFTQVVKNLPWSIKDWGRILADKELLTKKLPVAIKNVKMLSTALVGKKVGGDLSKIINWLYTRFFLKPRRMIKVLSRIAGVQGDNFENLKCKNGNKLDPLGSCIFEEINGDGADPKLTEELKRYLETGKNLRGENRECRKLVLELL